MNRFQIGNVKAFSDLQTIPLKPITIIFGPNSSGKSSVLHSLLLGRHEKAAESSFPVKKEMPVLRHAFRKS
ncbi:MAG: hypothetical protein EOM20_16115 [Spartobacteria bacterium]|nr:hypothetical protein [Spartobacteria bacterium]